MPTVLKSEAVEYIHGNIGLPVTMMPEAVEYVHANIGLPVSKKATAVEYVTADVNTDTPNPYLYAIVPSAARASDGISLIGHGFGATQAEFSSTVEVNHPGVGWEAISVVSWTRVAATGDAYGPSRMIDVTIPDIDPEHDVIDVTVPTWAIPPGIPFRVKTNGP